MIAYIPSKGRPKTKTFTLLQASGFTTYHFLEPQDYDLYDVPNKVNILQNDKGITYVRNFMLDHAVANGVQFALVCDDDINSFGEAKNKKAKNTPNADALLKPYKIFSAGQFALGGFNQRQFAWSETKPYKVNQGKVSSCFFVNLKRVSWRYKEGMKQDLDFIMQCLDNRQSFVYFCRVFYNMPAIGSNLGGLHELYKQNKDALWARKVASDWSDYAKLIQQYGRTDVRLDYKQKAIDMGLKVV